MLFLKDTEKEHPERYEETKLGINEAKERGDFKKEGVLEILKCNLEIKYNTLKNVYCV